MAAPTLSGSASGTISGASSGTAVLTTLSINDVVVVVVGYENPTNVRTVSTVTSPGLTFTQRSASPITSASIKMSIEVWTAPAALVLTAAVITVTMSASVDGACICAFGVNGAVSLSTPFDSNVSLPSAVSAATGLGSPGTQPTYSTSQANDFVFGVGLVPSPQDQTSATWTVIKDIQNNTPPANWCYMGVYYKAFTSTQSGATADLTGTSGGNPQIRMVDAITADSTASAVLLGQAWM